MREDREDGGAKKSPDAGRRASGEIPGLEEHFGLVNLIATRLAEKLPGSVDIEDLIQEGRIGLMEAHQTFNPGRGVLFNTYASPRIRGAMLDSVREQDWVPRLARRRNNLVKAVRRKIEAAQPEPASEEEILAELEPTLGREESLRVLNESNVAEMDTAVHGKRGEDFQHGLGPECEFAIDHREERERRLRDGEGNIEELVRGLPRTHRMIVKLYYGQNLTGKEIGQAIGLSESRISQLHSQAMQMLRAKMNG